MRCSNLWAESLGYTCHFQPTKKWVSGKTVRVWRSMEEDYSNIKYFMEMGAYKTYCKALKGWIHNYGFTAQGLGIGVWLMCALLIMFECVGRTIDNCLRPQVPESRAREVQN